MKHTESGRTMLESLGVLAIVGVLSIAGLQGYTAAMKRLCANELLNEANKRAVAVATQLMAGRNPEDVIMGEFPNDIPYGNFASAIIPNGNDKFKLKISDLDEGTCDLMEELATGPIRRLECVEEEGKDTFTAEMYFNKDLSTTERASDYTSGDTCKSPYKWCSGSKLCIEEKICTCSGSVPSCQICDPDRGSYKADSYQEGNGCKTNPSLQENDGICQKGICVPTSTGYENVDCWDYQTNAQCGGIDSGWYCLFDTNVTDTSAGSGKCMQIPDTTIHHSENNGGLMNWWTAYSFCKGLGLDMVTGRENSSVQCGDIIYEEPCTNEPDPHPIGYWLDTCLQEDDSLGDCSYIGYGDAYFVDNGEPENKGYRSGQVYALCE